MEFMDCLIIFSYMSGLFMFCKVRGHFMLMLLSLEFMMLFLYLSIYFNNFIMMGNIIVNMIFLTLIVGEGVLGLSILVLMIRSYGSDYILSFNQLW
nr:NADH dehydrogenase subunit 4L [Wallacea dactyliferae]